MNIDLRRSKRYNDFLPVSVLVRNGVTGNSEVDPFAGRIINIVQHGVCLLMSLGILDTYNLYRSTYKKESLHLEIQGSVSHAINSFTLASRPIWMEPFPLDDIRAFKMGVEFLSSADSGQSDEIIDNITAEPVEEIFEIEKPK